MAQIIPIPQQTPPLPFFDVTATLDGVTYTLEFRWNTRDANWFMRVLDEPGQNVLMGDTRVVADWPLYPWAVVRYPAGAIVPTDTSGQGKNPGLADLGARVVLLYLTAAEVA